jgi:hypothetical protein
MPHRQLLVQPLISKPPIAINLPQKTGAQVRSQKVESQSVRGGGS